MKLFTRDELVSLYRRSVGLQKDVPNDAVAHQTKQWSKRTLAGKIHGLVKARTFGMLDGVVVAVAAIMGLAGGWIMRGDVRTGDAIPINVSGGYKRGEMRAQFSGGQDGPVGASLGSEWACNEDNCGWVHDDNEPDTRFVDLHQSTSRDESDESDSTSSNLDNKRAPTMRSSRARAPTNLATAEENETPPPSVSQPNKQRILIATLCAVIAGGGWAGITHGINVSARTRIRNRFAKHLRTLRAKRPSATSRRLTRFVKRFGRTK